MSELASESTVRRQPTGRSVTTIDSGDLSLYSDDDTSNLSNVSGTDGPQASQSASQRSSLQARRVLADTHRANSRGSLFQAIQNNKAAIQLSKQAVRAANAPLESLRESNRSAHLRPLTEKVHTNRNSAGDEDSIIFPSDRLEVEKRRAGSAQRLETPFVFAEKAEKADKSDKCTKTITASPNHLGKPTSGPATPISHKQQLKELIRSPFKSLSPKKTPRSPTPQSSPKKLLRRIAPYPLNFDSPHRISIFKDNASSPSSPYTSSVSPPQTSVKRLSSHSRQNSDTFPDSLAFHDSSNFTDADVSRIMRGVAEETETETETPAASHSVDLNPRPSARSLYAALAEPAVPQHDLAVLPPSEPPLNYTVTQARASELYGDEFDFSQEYGGPTNEIIALYRPEYPDRPLNTSRSLRDLHLLRQSQQLLNGTSSSASTVSEATGSGSEPRGPVGTTEWSAMPRNLNLSIDNMQRKSRLGVPRPQSSRRSMRPQLPVPLLPPPVLSTSIPNSELEERAEHENEHEHSLYSDPSQFGRNHPSPLIDTDAVWLQDREGYGRPFSRTPMLLNTEYKRSLDPIVPDEPIFTEKPLVATEKVLIENLLGNTKALGLSNVSYDDLEKLRCRDGSRLRVDRYGRKRCSASVSGAIMLGFLFFPPGWLLLAGGYMDELVGVVSSRHKVISLGLAVTLGVICLVWILVYAGVWA